jgi:hypothetical protein
MLIIKMYKAQPHSVRDRPDGSQISLSWERSDPSAGSVLQLGGNKPTRDLVSLALTGWYSVVPSTVDTQ